ncbi:CD99 antigen-like protein 2 isoform X2 [Heterocephalus glaber]|uniref:CD99 antigen-like protein 2 n=1 Tax=Heterocephalus glaber TaxID=10181 RepID=A0A0N8EU40_HETGA|nr:CD99 antigen-like protein 2 isoform X2 [Heterocephalus glaber]
MVAWRQALVVCVAFSLATVVHRGSGDSRDELNLEHGLPETSSVKQQWEHHITTTTRRPGAAKAPANPAVDDFNLADGLDDGNDRDDGPKKPSAAGEGFSDKDLEEIVGGGYRPDKNKGDGGYGGSDDPGAGMSAETGTIAGVASALAMALIGAVSSYISYQQKKFCFSIQQGLNADYVKGENLESVVSEEPQVKYSALQTQASEPPPPEPPRI